MSFSDEYAKHNRKRMYIEIYKKEKTPMKCPKCGEQYWEHLNKEDDSLKGLSCFITHQKNQRWHF